MNRWVVQKTPFRFYVEGGGQFSELLRIAFVF